MVKIIGGWHGGYDSLHLAVHAPFNTAESAGLNPKTIEDTVTISFNDIEAAEKALRTEDKACIVIEPILGAAGFIPAEKEYLKALREICDDTGTILIFDEVITGFRVSPGGAQEYYKVIPDLTVMGKVLGGGFGIGAFTGKKEIFELIDHEKYPKMEERSAHGGTFTGNPISMTAGITTLDIIKDGKVHGYVNDLGSKVRQGIREIIDDNNTPASITGVGSCFALHFRETPPVNAEEAALADSEKSKLYFSHMLEKNIAYMSPTLVHAFLCEPHTAQDVDDFLSATETFFKHHDI
jgi:glutamate-1-semialdehyde 2,1-aminomutase